MAKPRSMLARLAARGQGRRDLASAYRKSSVQSGVGTQPSGMFVSAKACTTPGSSTVGTSQTMPNAPKCTTQVNKD